MLAQGAIDGDTIVVGGTENGFDAVYVFVRSGFWWTQQARLIDIDAVNSAEFGLSVAVAGDTLVVGSPSAFVGANQQGVACVFTRSGHVWTRQARLNAGSDVFDDRFGSSVAIAGDTVVVGAPMDDVGTRFNQGSAYVFKRIGAGWVQQAKLIAADGAAWDSFGSSVAIAGETVVVGAPWRSVGANFFQGVAYPFTRRGSAWVQQSPLHHAGGDAPVANFGASVAMSGDFVIVGAPWFDAGASVGRGSVSVMTMPAHDLSAVRNEVTEAGFPSLASAAVPALSGQQLTATDGAWRTAGSLNTFGRSLGLAGDGDIRVPSTSVLDLGGSSALMASAGSVVDIFGQLRVSGYVNVDGAAFRLGSRGVMTARTGSSLSINAPAARVDGQTRVEQGAALTASGDWTNIGPVTMSQDASFMTGGTVRNIDAWTMGADSRVVAGGSIENRASWTMTAGELQTTSFTNLLSFNVFGTSAIFGRFVNSTGATTTIRSGSLFVFGDLSNGGTLIGTVCSTCSGLPPAMDVGGTLALGPNATFTMPYAGSVVRVGGSFECRIRDQSRFDMALSTLQLESERPEVTMEALSRDIGADVSGLDRTLRGHFPIGELHIGGFPTTVVLVDDADNASDDQGAREALYVDTLRIDAGSVLINETCRIYYNTLINDGEVRVPENLIPLGGGAACPADFNQDGGVDGGDVDAFFVAWEGGDSAADVNQDGGVDGGDVDVFFVAWENGGC